MGRFMSEYGKEYLDAFVDYLELAGYNITKPIRTLNAADFGVPQSRKRVFVLGTREDLGVTVPYPEPIAERVTVLLSGGSWIHSPFSQYPCEAM